MEVNRDVWDLDDDQLWEALDALQTEMAWREGVAPPLGSPCGNLFGPGGGMAKIDDGEMDPDVSEDGNMANLHSGLQVPLRFPQMLADSSAYSQPG